MGGSLGGQPCYYPWVGPDTVLCQVGFSFDQTLALQNFPSADICITGEVHTSFIDM